MKPNIDKPLHQLRKSSLRKLVKALRSDKYDQSLTCLNNGEGFCCLGVASDLVRKEKGGTWRKLPNGPYDDNEKYLSLKGNGGSNFTSFPGPVVLRWLGYTQAEIDSVDLDNLVPNALSELARLNDKGVSFSAIADTIDSHIKLIK